MQRKEQTHVHLYTVRLITSVLWLKDPRKEGRKDGGREVREGARERSLTTNNTHTHTHTHSSSGALDSAVLSRGAMNHSHDTINESGRYLRCWTE